MPLYETRPHDRRRFAACFPSENDDAEEQWQKVALFLILAKTTPRHFIYAPRLLWQPPEDLRRYLRGIRQGEPVWFATRLFFIGASNLGFVIGSAKKWRDMEPDPRCRKTAERVLQDILGITVAEPFIMHPRIRHGQIYEDLGRDIYVALVLPRGGTHRVVEIGTAISRHNPMYSHSPDGLVVRTSDDKVVGVIEIKCQWQRVASRPEGCYTECPDGYIPQCLQGMMVHIEDTELVEGEAYCDFISVYYHAAESRGEPKHEVVVTIERLWYCQAAVWQQGCLNTFSKAIADNVGHLPEDLYASTSSLEPFPAWKTQFQAPHLKRGPIKAWVNDVANQPLRQQRLHLIDALGGTEEAVSRARYWQEKGIAEEIEIQLYERTHPSQSLRNYVEDGELPLAIVTEEGISISKAVMEKPVDDAAGFFAPRLPEGFYHPCKKL